MLNKYGGVFEAHEQPDGSFRLNRTARAWLGPGRPLGAGFDAAGNIIVCDALKVRPAELRRRTGLSHLCCTCSCAWQQQRPAHSSWWHTRWLLLSLAAAMPGQCDSI